MTGNHEASGFVNSTVTVWFSKLSDCLLLARMVSRECCCWQLHSQPMDIFSFHGNCTSQRHGMLGNHKACGFVNHMVNSYKLDITNQKWEWAALWIMLFKFIQLPLIAIFLWPTVTKRGMDPFVPLLRLSTDIPNECKKVTILLYASKPVPRPSKVAIFRLSYHQIWVSIWIF